MPEWNCPNCRGGFPTPEPGEDDADECPWCGQLLDASYEFEPVRSVVRSEDSDDDGHKLLQLFR